MTTQTAKLDTFFNGLKRPRSPNNWLMAPADFHIKPDAVAPVFQVPKHALIDAFKSVVVRSKGLAIIEESANAIHTVATTPVMRFKDDVWALFIPVTENKSTLALYSASRVGYWDMGTNRRRLNDWIDRLQIAAGILPG